MKRYYGGNPVPNGVYLNLRTLEFKQLRGEHERLPEPATDKYIRLNRLAGLIVAAIMGLAFIMLLPLIGIAGFILFLVYKVGLMRNNKGRRVIEVLLAQR